MKRQLMLVFQTLSRAKRLHADEYVGPGYALPTPEMVEAVRLLAKQKVFYLIQYIQVQKQ